MGKWLAGILASIISGVTVFYLTHGKPTSTPETPIPPNIPDLSKTLDVSGNWQGTIFQQLPNGTTAQYSYKLNLSQNSNIIQGTATLQAPLPYGYLVKMKIRGTIDNDLVEFDDGQILSNTAPYGWLWCQKEVSLTYENNNTLQGTWSQNGCGSGQVSLSK